MGGVADSLLGSGGGSIDAPSPGKIIKKIYPKALSQITDSLNISTPYSSFDQGTGALSFDPTGRDLMTGALDTYGTNLGQTRQSLLGNQGAFIQARVNPLLEQLALGRGQLQRNLGRTNVRGTFANQALENYDITGNRAVADQRALATQETLNAVSSLDQALFGAQSGIGAQLNADQLAQLGLSAQTIYNLRALASNLATGSASIGLQGQIAQAGADTSRAGNLSGLLGSGLMAGGLFFGGPEATTGIKSLSGSGTSGFMGSAVHGGLI